jgi:ribose transport system permease protein
MTAGTGTTTPPRAARLLTRAGSTLAPLAGLGAVLILAAITTPTFFTGGVLRLVLIQIGLIGITAVGQTMVLLVGGIDLSVGAVMALTTVIVAVGTGGNGARLGPVIGLAVLAGLVVGAVNAALVVWRDVPPFVATFAAFVLVQGTIVAWTRGAPAGSIPTALAPLGTGSVLGVPVPTWLFVLAAVITGVVLARTTAGRRIYATGLNARATALAGVRTGQVVAVCYLVSALLAVLAGLINAGYIGYVDAQLSRSLDLNSIAAAVIGGVALTGGRGRMGQTAIGVVLLAVVLVWLVQLGAGAGARYLVEGAIILLAVWLQKGAAGRRT